MPLDWSPLWLSLRYAGWATLLASLVALPLAWILARRRFPGSAFLDAAATLPLVLPPAVLVYYLLAALGRWPLHFSWHAAVGELVRAHRQRLTDWPVAATPGASRAHTENVEDCPALMLTGTSW